jgi:hypothetical protein
MNCPYKTLQASTELVMAEADSARGGRPLPTNQSNHPYFSVDKCNFAAKILLSGQSLMPVVNKAEKNGENKIVARLKSS